MLSTDWRFCLLSFLQQLKKRARLGQPQVLAGSIAVAVLLPWTSARADGLHVEGVLTDTQSITDIELTPSSIFVASRGGVVEYDRTSLAWKKNYSHLDGLNELEVLSLERRARSSLVARTKKGHCSLAGQRFVCHPGQDGVVPPTGVSLEFEGGSRVTVRKEDDRDRTYVGTSSRGVWVDGEALPGPTLPGAHVTDLSALGDLLVVGTFNHGLAHLTREGRVRALPHGPRRINALVVGRKHLFVGASSGLFRTADGLTFERVERVDSAVVGLAFDGTSVWASTPGALYRIRDGAGPRSDVWWVPGGSHSLQKVSAVTGTLWLATEDRGALRLRTHADLTSGDRGFEVFDRTRGFPSSWSLSVAALRDGSALMTSLNRGAAWIELSGRARRVDLPPASSGWGLCAYAEDDGVWIGAQGGATYVPRAGIARAVHGLPHPNVHVIYRDARPGLTDRVWLGTENGLAWITVSASHLEG